MEDAGVDQEDEADVPAIGDDCVHGATGDDDVDVQGSNTGDGPAEVPGDGLPETSDKGMNDCLRKIARKRRRDEWDGAIS